MKYWSLLFGLTTVLAVAAFAYAPFDDDWWLPSYKGTNAGALETLGEISGQAPGMASTLGAMKGGAGATGPAGLQPLDEARAWADGQSARLGRLASEGFLTGRTRALQGRAAGASAAMIEARAALAAGDGADPALDEAIEALEGLGEGAAGAIASVTEPGGGLRAPVSTAAVQIDHLYILILLITGLTFVGVMAAMVVAMWRFRARPGRKAVYSHGSLKVEIVWTVIPAAILVFLALYQLRAWADIKFKSTYPDVAPLAEITARQFQWKMRYPGPDGELGTGDDLHTVNDLHFVKDEPTIIHLKSEDVLHSFFLPQLRIKQDAVPGMTIPVLFDASKAGRYELLCAELCGWGHYKMRAQVVVHETRDEFDEWVEQALREQDRSEPAADPAGAEADLAAAPEWSESEAR
ncbi:cytochrome c oxidase subunit II [Tautonia plasticadhaerens]|uniref:Cytochrome c oxidase subunit 2 n=1 Tax=Tautonia plasticadhaerens TaxID=2527974 RepID=A0A518GZR5_9BACT|nr:cytochrome c oxidase subunit II [Tautonia plasticadhaerens]QDV34077.1 Alternative cytochrome c oxidase subunit 2 [Tautonia plasticadhaerens]